MASPTAETDRPQLTRRGLAWRGLAWRGLVTGACAGAVVGLIDALLSLYAGNELVRGDDALHVVGFYAAAFAICGVLASVVAQRFEWSRRALALLVSVGAGLFPVGAWLNVNLLPDFKSGISIATDIVLIVAAIVWFRRSLYGPGSDEIRWGRWLGAGVLAVLIGFGLRWAPDAGDGPEVLARAAPGATRPNVLIFMVDTLRADALTPYGYEQDTSPEVAEFAADAVLFRDCRATTSWTKPSVASLFTSLYPTAHACVQQREVLVPEAETLAEVFRSAGWRTAAFSDNPFITPEFGFGQGFDHFDAVRPSVIANGTLLGKVLFMTRMLNLVGTPFGVGHHVDRGVATLVDDGLLPWIDDADAKEPWFAYLHTMEPHLPYDPPREDATEFGFRSKGPYGGTPPYNGVLPFQVAPEPDPEMLRNLRAQYDGEVRDVSRHFGRLLGELRERGELENTIVVFVSDHGEEFHDHGGWTHGHSLHREVVQVPLIMRLPDSLGSVASAARGRGIDGVASLLDVFPTLTELTGVKYPKGEASARTGLSLVPNLMGEDGKAPKPSVPIGRTLLGEVTMGPVSLRSIREGRWLLITAQSPFQSAGSLYDAVSDKLEVRDRSEREALTWTQMEGRIAELFAALEKVALVGAAREIDGETAAKLEAIGYVQGKDR